MTFSLKQLLILSLVFLPFSAKADDAYWKDRGWEKTGEEDGISSYRKSMDGSPLKGVGGEALIEAPIENIISVLLDSDHKAEWVDRFKNTYTIEELSPTSYVIFSSFKMPFPVSDREFVYSYNLMPSDEYRGVIVKVQSVESAKTPKVKRGDVRGKIVDGEYILIPRGDQTIIIAKYLADPRGSLPSWIVNMVQKSWPLKTIRGLKEQVKKDYIRPWPKYNEELGSKIK